MIERGCRARLLLETPRAVSVRRKIGGQKFDGDFTVQPRVFGEINLARTAYADLRADFVATELRVRGKGHTGDGDAGYRRRKTL